MPSFSLNQKNINPESIIPAYQQLHSHNALIALNREMKKAMNKEKESTHTPKINNNINKAQIEFVHRFEQLHRFNDSKAQEVIIYSSIKCTSY